MLKAGSEIDLIIWNIDFAPKIEMKDDHKQTMLVKELDIIDKTGIHMEFEQLND